MIKAWLKRLPRVYCLLQRGWYGGLYFCERYVLGTKVHELLWRARRVGKSAGCSQCHPHRAFLAERIGRFAPIESILEVGCNGAPNLVVLGRAYPGVRLYGVDISRRSIKMARTVILREAVGNAALFVGSADDLRCFADGSIDVVLTDATLMYVGPDKITRVVSELVRVGRTGLIFNEWHLFEGHSTDRAHWHYAHWVHDFRWLLGGLPGVKAVRVERLPAGLWDPGGGWGQYGALVEVELSDRHRCSDGAGGEAPPSEPRLDGKPALFGGEAGDRQMTGITVRGAGVLMVARPTTRYRKSLVADGGRDATLREHSGEMRPTG